MDLAHLHLMLNHIPVIGVIFGFLILLGGVIFRSRAVSRVGLGMLVVSAVAAVPVYLTGEPAEEIVEKMPGVADQVIDEHESSAAVSLGLIIALGVAAAAALFISRFPAPRLNGGSAIGILLLSLITGTSMIRTANLGGQVRHTEIRSGGLAPAAETEPGTKRRGVEREHDDD